MILLVALATVGLNQVQALDDVSPRDRAYISAKLYSAVDSYFGHLVAIPEFKLEDEFPKFLDKAFAAKGRYDFDLACLEFVASLKNGHSNFYDPWLQTYRGASLGFYARYIENQWVVDSSRNPKIKIGDVISKVDGNSLEDLYQANKKYICASSDRDCRNRFLSQGFLFPRKFNLQKSDGTIVEINRIAYPPRAQKKTEGKWIDPNVAYLKVPGFDDPSYENDALRLLKGFSNAKALIIDVRQNGGGNTPSDLIDALMDRPYRSGTFTTPQTIAAFRVWGSVADDVEKDPRSAKDESYGEASVYRDLGYGYYYAPPTSKPAKPSGFKGKLFILINRSVFSAGEDFCIPFKDNHRAIFIGEATGGSTGQPLLVRFQNGMAIRVSTKRDTFPDGSKFEGVGVKPDIEVPTTIADTKSGHDSVLEKALKLAAGK